MGLYGDDGRLRVCDFGLARRYGEPLENYTFNVVTQWYRCPELLMGQRKYSTAVMMNCSCNRRCLCIQTCIHTYALPSAWFTGLCVCRDGQLRWTCGLLAASL